MQVRLPPIEGDFKAENSLSRKLRVCFVQCIGRSKEAPMSRTGSKKQDVTRGFDSKQGAKPQPEMGLRKQLLAFF